MKKLLPKRRFREFKDSEAWEQRELGEFSDIRTGPFGSMLHAKDYVKEGTPIITTEHFKTGDLPEEKNEIPQVSDEDLHRLQSYVLKTDDIVFSRVGSIDINALVTTFQSGWLFSGRVLRVRTDKNIDSQYLHYELSTSRVKNDVISRAVGQTMPSINTEILKQTKVFIPTQIKEQQDIGRFMRDLDNLITLHQRKLKKLKNLKSAYLSEMFPKEGELYPKRRFAGFTGPWEQRKLKEIASSTHGGGTPSTSNEEFWNGNIPWIQSSDLTENEVFGISPKRYISEAGLRNSATKLVPENSIAIITRVGVGKLAFIPFSYTTSQDFLSLSGLKIDPWFGVYVCYIKLRSELYKVQGTSIKGITKEELLEMSILVPRDEEQKKIGEFFKKLDNLITLQQRKLKKLEALKQAYLSEMFV